ncbi:HugZ family pyridoxamine 5'-phosphate oxidase [Methylobacter sp. YRD-M1]|uniref:HugZ family pyridoxamine 5'-phosphate oxidase n=1 Tax=Methylobacter sp. YRD-M1 TaxID=2911520 RepID=UPI00227A2A47|nr:pyridoxamine 5'-phosphate oxidase family protein [Methylobacter sp. YRD-M1]WAK01195.1 pyridoxamine 5'-phosphate oxidase family protein [Methylobacter sp. YRD-M1]
MNETENLDDIALDCHKLIASQQTLLLSTATANGAPDISYAPFVQDQAGCFYVFVSELASHTANLLQNPQASVMFIRPESESHNLFARERAVFGCKAKEIPYDDETYAVQLQALSTKFGEVVNLLRSLSDFHLFALRPENGRYVIGFGRAYIIDMSDGSVHPVNSKT